VILVHPELAAGPVSGPAATVLWVTTANLIERSLRLALTNGPSSRYATLKINEQADDSVCTHGRF
jgi:hypothetical protein